METSFFSTCSQYRWRSSYFIASCGGVTVSALRKYIENQDAPESRSVIAELNCRAGVPPTDEPFIPAVI
ncbi:MULTISPECIES: transposase [unclassified Microcoleus]|uniref:transposase n=1 Tax=unclassified Microcoleus TaxID=2642155 RepID=UPI0025FDBF6B|nr:MULTISPECIES: transposase [unclassified Microcoleus]